MYRLNTEVKVSMAFIIPSDVVARLINSIVTVPRCLTGFYHVTKYLSNCMRRAKPKRLYKRAHHWLQTHNTLNAITFTHYHMEKQTSEEFLDFLLSQIDENALEAINNIDSAQYSEQFAAPPTTRRFSMPKTDKEIFKAQETGEPMTTACRQNGH